jgi:hypothetical protein
VRLYGRRFTIEEAFRDVKDPRYGLGLSTTHEEIVGAMHAAWWGTRSQLRLADYRNDLDAPGCTPSHHGRVIEP